ncbi:MAG: helix-turn-helix domain-containing protein [Bacteroidia bacterium]|nr:helix-turn-helix domain-containing protein [Bacteroidia bacterium]
MKKLTLGEKTARIRTQKGVSQKEMADKIGMEQSGYSKLEHKGDDIAFSTLKKICSVLEIDPVALLIEHNPERVLNDKEFNEVLMLIAVAVKETICNYKVLMENQRLQHVAERELLIEKIKELHRLLP